MRRLHIVLSGVALAIVLPTLYWCFTTTVGPGTEPKVDRFARVPKDEAYELRIEPWKDKESDPCDEEEMEKIRGAITDELMTLIPVNLADRDHRGVGTLGVITFHLAVKVQRYSMTLKEPGRPSKAVGDASASIPLRMDIQTVTDARAAAGGRFRGWKREYAVRGNGPASIRSKGGELLASAFDEACKTCLKSLVADLVSQLRKDTR